MRKHLLLLPALLLVFQFSMAQNYEAPEVKLSTDKANIDGKVYFVHKVEPKQTVFSICKAYGVTQETLLETNPALAGGLKAGSFILIPEAAAEASQPVQAVQNEPEEQKAPSEARTKEKWYDKLLNVFKFKQEKKSRDENVQEEAGPAADTLAAEAVSAAAEESVSAIRPGDEDVRPEKARRERTVYSSDRPLKISLLIPVNAAGSPSANYLDFYCGALSALRDLKDNGCHVELTVFDTKSENPLSDSRLKESDLIIGPVHAADVETYAQFARKNRIPIVSPMDIRTEKYIDGNPYFLLAPATDSIQLNNLVRSVQMAEGDNVYLFYNSTLNEADLVNRIKSRLDLAGIEYLNLAYDLLKGRELGERLGHQWSNGRSYKVIVASEDAAFAPDVVRNLKLIAKNEVPLRIFCCNTLRNWEEAIDYDTFYRTQAHVSAPYWVDYQNEATQKFLHSYRALFNTEPTAFSFQGHDLVTYFVNVMYRDGFDPENDTALREMHCLQGNFKFERRDNESGWQNTATRNLIYNTDFTVSLDGSLQSEE